MYTQPGTFFNVHFNEIAVELSNVGQHGIQLQPGMLELFLLLFADDLALLSSTAIGLQNPLNQLSRMCEERLLKINIEKTKVVVFRKGGQKRWTSWQKRGVVFRKPKVRCCEQLYVSGVYLY